MGALVLILLLSAKVSAEPALPKNFLAVPIVPQATNYSCGAASLLAVLYYWLNYDGNESDLYAELGTEPKHGTRAARIAEAARRRGLKAELREGLSLADLRAALARKATVMLHIQAWREKSAPPKTWRENWENNHYVILIGIDAANAYFMDPSAYTAYAWLPLSELLERWHNLDYGSEPPRRCRNRGILIRGEGRPRLAGLGLTRVE